MAERLCKAAVHRLHPQQLQHLAAGRLTRQKILRTEPVRQEAEHIALGLAVSAVNEKRNPVQGSAFFVLRQAARQTPELRIEVGKL